MQHVGNPSADEYANWLGFAHESAKDQHVPKILSSLNKLRHTLPLLAPIQY
jgi:hypothetical protein